MGRPVWMPPAGVDAPEVVDTRLHVSDPVTRELVNDCEVWFSDFSAKHTPSASLRRGDWRACQKISSFFKILEPDVPDENSLDIK